MKIAFNPAAFLSGEEFCNDVVMQDSELCKVYNDGSHYIAVPYHKSGVRPPVRRKRELSAMDDELGRLWREALNTGVKYRDTAEYVKTGLMAAFPDVIEDWDSFVAKGLKRERNNLKHRAKLLRRKAAMIPWTHWVTFTYRDLSEDGLDGFTRESFAAALFKCLANFATRRHWLVILVPEDAPDTGRLHYHGLIYVPPGQMVGKITKKPYKSTSDGRIKIRHENSFFAKRFGVNDFQSVNNAMLKAGSSIKYLLKYIAKSGNKVRYSRGIKACVFKVIPKSYYAAPMFDYVQKYVLWDNVISWERDIAAPVEYEQICMNLSFGKRRKRLFA